MKGMDDYNNIITLRLDSDVLGVRGAVKTQDLGTKRRKVGIYDGGPSSAQSSFQIASVLRGLNPDLSP